MHCYAVFGKCRGILLWNPPTLLSLEEANLISSPCVARRRTRATEATSPTVRLKGRWPTVRLAQIDFKWKRYENQSCLISFCYRFCWLYCSFELFSSHLYERNVVLAPMPCSARVSGPTAALTRGAGKGATGAATKVSMAKWLRGVTKVPTVPFFQRVQNCALVKKLVVSIYMCLFWGKTNCTCNVSMYSSRPRSKPRRLPPLHCERVAQWEPFQPPASGVSANKLCNSLYALKTSVRTGPVCKSLCVKLHTPTYMYS